jgi:hypothetical protein
LWACEYSETDSITGALHLCNLRVAGSWLLSVTLRRKKNRFGLPEVDLTPKDGDVKLPLQRPSPKEGWGIQ